MGLSEHRSDDAFAVALGLRSGLGARERKPVGEKELEGRQVAGTKRRKFIELAAHTFGELRELALQLGS
ncbi:uncharacterized protein STEHIDRAFT_117157 [Stereum hirsutum FP-91666 SS1]|uniref:uncharacterized protein n=1 Tax=Stereum hirsutum (strain FP-91666) TaxID=721885 RepID=UPI000440D5D2|nr:uncharacterized protein STEHIDRAFT_117157 [Stereum hirsutum FP-91666 SS1]EIM92066.1 hypothetical protein STEHIDRAFT_117157 [Stereum hirsutum FP-91666 SS1]